MRFAHTNLIASDWRALAAFYETVFGCVRVGPERDQFGDALERGTGVAGARLAGVHLRLPGYGEDGPSLEVYSYAPGLARTQRRINHPGFGHIAFEVEDVAATREAFLGAGGRALGEVVTLAVGEKFVTWCYLEDPEGNAVELQSWSEAFGPS